MKKLITMTIMVLAVATLMAQTPEKLTYQAVVRNAGNALVTNTQVGVRVSILQGSASGSAVYVETQTTTTNANGLMTVEIGGGNAQQGSFASIDWADGPYFLKSETDPNGGSNYSVTSTQQLLSVPYALYAKAAGNGFSGDYNDLTNVPEIPTVPTNVSAFTNDAGYITTQDVPTIPTVPTNVSAFTNDVPYLTAEDIPTIPTVPTNVSAFTNDVPYLTAEQQILSISHDTIFLTGGSFVKLPAGFDGDYNSLVNKPTIPTVPTNVSAFVNDADYLTDYTETDPQYNAWNKDYNDLINKPVIPTVPTNVSAFNNDVPYLTAEQQILSISNDTIFLTGGSFVKLPEGFSGSWNDLTDKPEIPEILTNVSELANDANYISNVGAECANNVNLCDLLNQLDALSDQIFNLQVETKGVTAVMQNTVTVNGEVTSDGGTNVNTRGFVYSTHHYPSITDLMKTAGSGMGTFTASISGLNPGTTYYLRAFAMNDNTVKYGNEVSVTTTALSPSVIPTVNTSFVSDVSTTMATISGNVISDGGSNITARGFVYDTLPNPTLNNHKAQNVAGTGTFSNLLTGLSEGTTYYTRSYATNGVGTAYGNELSFTTVSIDAPTPVGDDGQPCPGTPTVSDHEGNVYNTVQIGTQCWTKENLRTTTSPSTGTYLVAPVGSPASVTGKQARWPYHDSTTYASQDYGLLYNWNAVVDTFHIDYGELSVISPPKYYLDISFPNNRRGICPSGWHVPSTEEWIILNDYTNRPEYIYNCHENFDPDIHSGYSKALCSTMNWNNASIYHCTDPASKPQYNNATGFSAIPSGFYDFTYSTVGNLLNSFGKSAYFASVDQQKGSVSSFFIEMKCFSITYPQYTWNIRGIKKSDGVSVRCLKD